MAPTIATPPISVVMPTFERGDRLEPVVRALLGDPGTSELIVVVDGCRDGSLEQLEAMAAADPRLRPVWTENRGENGARELGLRTATHAVALLIDDDVLAGPGLVSGHARHHAGRDDLVVLGHMPVPADVQERGGAPARLYARWYEEQCRAYEARPGQVLDHLWGGNLSLHRERALAVGLDNPAFDARYNPDRDLGLRLAAAGLTGRFDRALRAEHRYQRSLGAFLRDAAATGEGTWLVHQLHPDAVGPMPQDAYLRTCSPRTRPAVRFAPPPAQRAGHPRRDGGRPRGRRRGRPAGRRAGRVAGVRDDPAARRAHARPPRGGGRMSERLPVSVVIPAYNRPAMTARAVASALAQRPLPPDEVLVVDDHSSDDTGAAAEAAGATVIRHPENRGEGQARNTGFEAARHAWVATLDSDDEWLPHHLATLWGLRDGQVLVGATALACRPGEATGALWGLERDAPLGIPDPAALLARDNVFVASGVMVRRDVALAAGGFRAGMQRCADLDLWLRVLELGTGVVSPAVTLRYHLHDAQVSDDRAAMWSAHRAVARSYAGRDWCSPGVLRRTDGMLEWDALRKDLADGRRRSALERLATLGADPLKAANAVRVVAARRRLRRRSDRFRAAGAGT